MTSSLIRERYGQQCAEVTSQVALGLSDRTTLESLSTLTATSSISGSIRKCISDLVLLSRIQARSGWTMHCGALSGRDWLMWLTTTRVALIGQIGIHRALSMR